MKPTNFDTINPAVRPIPPSYRWYRLLDPVSYDVGEPLSGDRITVPVGFETDFASIPRSLWSILPPFDKHLPAAIIHDYLYTIQTRTRKECDAIFLESMQVLGVGWFRRQIMHKGVRAGGWRSWNKAAEYLAMKNGKL